MKSMCRSCIAYLVQHDTADAEICSTCGHYTLIWKQNSFGTFYLECSYCGDIEAVDLNTPCEHDTLLRQNIKIEIKPQEELPDKIVIIRVGKRLGLSALEMRKKLMVGYDFEVSYYEFRDVINMLQKHEIKHIVKQDIRPTEQYPFCKECKYPYSPLKYFLGIDY